jgi:DNA adenine methylase
MDQAVASDTTNFANMAARPFLKWVGGKGRLLTDLLSRVPKKYGTYFEPFLGGGALFFSLRPSAAEISDLNPELINAYQVVRDFPSELIRSLSIHKNTKRYFYKLRALDRRGDFWTFPPVERASRFIFLNKTCFNGLCRVNSEGQFNVPFGMYKNPTIVDETNLLACCSALQGANLSVAGYDRVIERARPGDFVYFDPPYVPLSATSSFTAYAESGFTLQNQVELAETCKELDRRGVQFMLTNSDTELVENLYREFAIERINSPRSVSADGERRKAVKDIVVRNY